MTGYGQVHFPVGGAGLGEAEGQFVAFVDNLVDVPLFGSELAGSGIGAGKIRSIMLVALHAGIYDHELAGLNDFVVKVIVQSFTVLGKDGGEGNAPALGQCNAFHLAHDILLYNAQSNAIARYGMHGYTKIAGFVYGFDLYRLLDQAHGDDGLDKGLGRCRRESAAAVSGCCNSGTGAGSEPDVLLLALPARRLFPRKVCGGKHPPMRLWTPRWAEGPSR